MAFTYREVNRAQQFLFPPSMLDWVPDNHMVWFVIEAVNQLDTSLFHQAARLGGVGRRGYDPDMLLTLFMYGMAGGVTSSRQIEKLCYTDVVYRLICAGDAPDHCVLARFRQVHEAAMTDMLTKTLGLAVQFGMVHFGVVAFDGTKIAGNASLGANRSLAGLQKIAKDYVDQVGIQDAYEDGLFGVEARGDELPEALKDRSHRGERIKQALDLIQAKEAEAAAQARLAALKAATRAGLIDQVARQEQAKVAEWEKMIASGAKITGRIPKGVDPVKAAEARWLRERDKADQRFKDWQQARQQDPSRPGGPVRDPDQASKVRAAWQDYQAAIAANAAQPADPVDPADTKMDVAKQADTDQVADSADPADPGQVADSAETVDPVQVADSADPADPGQVVDSADPGVVDQMGDVKGRGRAKGDSRKGDQRVLKVNLTDPDSRTLKTRNGWIQGYNCQTSATKEGFFLNARVTQDANDVHQFIPTMRSIEQIARLLAKQVPAGSLVDDLTIGVLIGDAGYDSDANLTAEGPDRLIADAKHRDMERRAVTVPAGPKPPPDADARTLMNYRLRTQEGIALYRCRSHQIEATNAWLKDGRGLRRFSRRGLVAAQAELSFACAVTNLLRLAALGITTADLAALPARR